MAKLFRLGIGLVLFAVVHPSDQQNPWDTVCSEDGRFHDPSNCGNYVDCIKGRPPRFGDCKGRPFHPIHKTCVSNDKVPLCHIRRSRAFTADNDLNYLCADIRNGFVCKNCKNLVQCIEGVAYAIPCKDSDVCVNKDAFKGATCYPEDHKDCSCNGTVNGFRVDPYNERMFYFCGEPGTVPVYYTCPAEKVFSLRSMQCEDEDGLPACTQIGVYAHPTDCQNYYTCIQTAVGWVQKKFTCPEKTMFSEYKNICEDPCHWPTGQVVCAEEGRFADPTDCTQFFECFFVYGEYVKRTRKCPVGFHWKTDSDSGIGHCVSVSKSTCKPFRPSSCNVPSDWCAGETVATNEVSVSPDKDQETDSANSGSQGSAPAEITENIKDEEEEQGVQGEGDQGVEPDTSATPQQGSTLGDGSDNTANQEGDSTGPFPETTTSDPTTTEPAFFIRFF